MKKILPILFLILLITACHTKPGDNSTYDMASPEKELVPINQESLTDEPVLNNAQESAIEKQKIIKDGRMRLRVKDLEKTKNHINTLLKEYKAYYANESYNNNDYESSYSLKIRIPNANFESFVQAIEKGDGEIIHKEVDARDVTSEFIDLETRLENKRSYLKRYRDLLKQAKSIKEILEIEEKIRLLEEEIESTTGRLKYLIDLVDYSTLDLTVFKQKEFRYNPSKRDKFSEKLKHSVSKGWFGFLDFLLFCIKIWPFWLMLGAFLYFWRKYRKKKKANG